MKKTVALVALAGIAAVASARPYQIQMRVRKQGDATWSTAIVVAPGDTVEVSSWYAFPESANRSMATSVHNIRLFGTLASDTGTLQDRADSTLHPDGRQGNFNFGGQKQQLYGATDWRISANNNNQDAAAGGISIKQNTPSALGTNLDKSNPAYGYLFVVKIDPLDPGAGRVITCDAPMNKINSYRTYDDGAGDTAAEDHKADLVATETATITVLIPAPGALALVGLGGLAAARRRR